MPKKSKPPKPSRQEEPELVHYFEGDKNPTEDGKPQKPICGNKPVPWNSKKKVSPRDHICAGCQKEFVRRVSLALNRILLEAERLEATRNMDDIPIGSVH